MKDLVAVEARQSLLAAEGVHSVGDSIRDGTPVVVVHVRPGARAAAVPGTVEGTPTVVERSPVARPLRARPAFADDYSAYYRPVRSGTIGTVYDHIGNSRGVGTMGFTLTDGDTAYLTSNNHTWADDDPQRVGYPVGNSSPGEPIATFTDYVPIEGGDTAVDFSWAERADGVGVTNEIPGIGTYSGSVEDPSVGDAIRYGGIRSGLVSGEVQEVNASGGVAAHEGPDWQYHDCIKFSPAAQRGDSGSPVVLDDGEPYTPTAQVFAGGSLTIAHTMSNVADLTGLQPISGPVGPQHATHNGRPRTDYTYCGADVGEFWQWVHGRQSTADFQHGTGGGEGTAALTTGRCDEVRGPAYDGRPRNAYTYCGSAAGLHEQWVLGSLSTGEFQSQTGDGQGTAALALGECGGDGQPSRAGVGAALAVGVAGAYLWQRRRG